MLLTRLKKENHFLKKSYIRVFNIKVTWGVEKAKRRRKNNNIKKAEKLKSTEIHTIIKV